MNTASTIAPLTIGEAVQKRLDAIAERNLRQAEKQRREDAERDERCAEVAEAIRERVRQQENIETSIADWFVDERVQGVTITYNCEYNVDAPGMHLGSEDDPISGVAISNLNRSAFASFNTVGDADGEWRAWFKSRSGHRFKTFTDAITFALTGKS